LTENTASASTRAKRKYNDKTYERIPLDVKIGTKAIYKEAADTAKMSLNAYIQKAVEEKIERDSSN
jgi:predicted HicB family RNase H-like nuclease